MTKTGPQFITVKVGSLLFTYYNFYTINFQISDHFEIEK
jgi:hypothetical protein